MEKVISHSRPLVEFCFRGWDPIDKTWRYGNLKKYIHFTKGPIVWITSMFGSDTEKRYLVASDSIGQWTGFCDETGEFIYEGDLIQPTDRYREYLFQTYGADTWTWTEPLEVYFQNGAFRTDAGVLSELTHGRAPAESRLLEARVTGTVFEKETENAEK